MKPNCLKLGISLGSSESEKKKGLDVGGAPPLRRLKEEDWKFQARLAYTPTLSFCHNKKVIERLTLKVIERREHSCFAGGFQRPACLSNVSTWSYPRVPIFVVVHHSLKSCRSPQVKTMTGHYPMIFINILRISSPCFMPSAQIPSLATHSLRWSLVHIMPDIQMIATFIFLREVWLWRH